MIRHYSFKIQKGFTLIEIAVVIGIIGALSVGAFLASSVFQGHADLTNNTEEIINVLRLAQNKTLSSEKDSSWGVYFSTSTDPHQYTLFKGNSYASRDAALDNVHQLPKRMEIYGIDLWEGEKREVVFKKVSGEVSTTGNVGNISLRLKSDVSKNKTIYIEESGEIGITNPVVPSDANRIKDSRHLHFEYSRDIATSTESIILNFTSGVSTTEEIIIAENFKNGQIFWEGSVDVGGSIQELKIHTHRLNEAVSPKTVFSIRRDMRYNNEALTITISGDTSGDLLVYSADGQDTTSTSIYVSNLQWQ